MVGDGLMTPMVELAVVVIPPRTPVAVSVAVPVVAGRNQLMAPKLGGVNVSCWPEAMYTVVALRVPREAERPICICPELGLDVGLSYASAILMLTKSVAPVAPFFASELIPLS